MDDINRKTLACFASIFRWSFVALVMVLVMMPEVTKAQSTDYSGVYYIGSTGWVQNATTTNYYLCSTEDWYYYQSAPPYYTNTDNGMPFMTTYPCRNGEYGEEYGEENAIWIVEKKPGQDVYTIRRAVDGKYLVYNRKMASGNEGRMRVHLEESPSDEDATLFAITWIAGKSCYDITTIKEGTRKYMNVTDGNKPSLQASGKTDGPDNMAVGGIIGLWTSGSSGDNNSKWYLESAVADAPVITNRNDGTVEITAAVGAKIYYTTDGTTPTTSTTTYGNTPIIIELTDDIRVIKAIAKAPSDYFPSLVTTYYIPVCARPVISVNEGVVTITCETEGASIFYTTNNTPAVPSSPPSNLYEQPFDFEDSYVVIRAMATKPGYVNSNEAYYYPHTIVVHSSDEINDYGMHGRYVLADDFSSSSTIGSAENPFTGIIDGNYNAFSFSHALIDVAEDAVIKNVTISNAEINGTGNVGALVNTAKGTTKIYNCGVQGGSVQGGANAGGLVGLIEERSSVRVVNCYNYANVSGSEYAAGIVGKNDGWASDDGSVGEVRIALCMMYGNVTGATNISPVYGGNHVSNSKNFTEYNFWRYRSGLTYTAGKYNDQLAIDKDEYLTRFPFYRHILNTHRELAAFFLFGAASCKEVDDISQEQVDEIGHWALKDNLQYPIIELWEKNTKKVMDAPTPSNILSELGNSGYLNVTVKVGNKVYEDQSLPITDMNEAKYDYTWGKVVLPFANEFEGWTRNYDEICTGWKITSVTKEGSTYTTPSVTNYDFADRDNPQKDIFNASTNPYVFAQGGNYIVPYGVTAITIVANFADAFYLSDASYDVGYDVDYANATQLGGSVPDQYHGKNVYTSLSTLVSALSTTTNPHDQAIVLVGNYHYRVSAANQEVLAQGKAVTIMSVDEDCNQEPDYGWYMGNTYGRIEVPPLRFDFVPNIEMGRSQRVDGRGPYPGVGIWHTRGWFELTETCVSNMIQCEINSDNFTNGDNGYGNNRWIANSGCFVQIVRARDGNCNKLSYIQIGGNAYVKELYPGSHTDNARTNKAVPILVTGGQVDECYMTGYKAGGKLTGNIYFWCAGGKIGKFLGAYLEEPSTANADLTAKVDHALIGRFFGGGTSAAARVKGNIDITINNSQVDFYCGGPEFGDMYSNKTVTTHATGTTFGVYYGAGFGGTSITYDRKGQTAAVDITTSPTAIYDLNFNLYTNNRLVFASGFGIGNCYKFEFIFNSNGKTAVSRFYTGYAQFSLATTGNVTNVLDHCTVTGNFYGAGCQGKVNGTVSSTLTDCSINGNAFGAGYKATANELDVYPTTQPAYSVYNREMGIFSDFGTVDPGTFTWAQGDATTQNTVSGTTLYTSKDVDMSTLGTVTNNVTLILNGGTTVGTGSGDTGNVYGGGEESAVTGNTTVNLEGGVTVHGNVYGGGNRGAVGGDSQVNILE